MQVPFFVLVQSFHSLKKEKPAFSLKKTFTRIFFPFFIVEIACYVFLVYVYRSDPYELALTYLRGGGIGPGSYFPWVYLQLAILLPMIRPLLNHGSILVQGLVAIGICEGLEIFASLADIPNDIYRLLAFRYFFLIYLGWLWVKKGICINKWTLLLSLASAIAILYFDHYQQNDEPIFYQTKLTTHRWPCYFYVSMLGTYIVFIIFKVYSKCRFIKSSVKMLAKCSYEIFLLQMVIIAICPTFGFIQNPIAEFIFRIILIFASSILGGFAFNKIYNTILLKFNL